MAQQWKFGGKELSEELGLNMYDFGARNYDAALGKWMNIDPLADAYFGLSPYNYVANNPILLNDFDGKKITFSIDYDDEGQISKVGISVTGKVIDNTKNGLSSKALTKARDKITKGISSISVKGNGVDVSFSSNIEIANSEQDIESDDHAFRIVDDVSKIPGANHTNPNTKAMGYGPLGENVVYLDKNFSSRTAAHETGHSAGLKHINQSTERDFNPYASDFLRYRARNTNGINGYYTAFQAKGFGTSVVTMATNVYSDNDYFGNLMHQARAQNAKGLNAAGYLITRGQVQSIMYNYENNNLNQGRQK